MQTHKTSIIIHVLIIHNKLKLLVREKEQVKMNNECTDSWLPDIELIKLSSEVMKKW